MRLSDIFVQSSGMRALVVYHSGKVSVHTSEHGGPERVSRLPHIRYTTGDHTLTEDLHSYSAQQRQRVSHRIGQNLRRKNLQQMPWCHAAGTGLLRLVGRLPVGMGALRDAAALGGSGASVLERSCSARDERVDGAYQLRWCNGAGAMVPRGQSWNWHG